MKLNSHGEIIKKGKLMKPSRKSIIREFKPILIMKLIFKFKKISIMKRDLDLKLE
jgi:hypothetical protein